MGEHNVAHKGRLLYMSEIGETSEKARKASLARTFVSAGEWYRLH